ncbi:hypothetical protein [Streptomyces sp. NPDC000983]|uniref:hypothetical protein n=1 Tax=Streptomyces sp. NPDC000983 TaxID=3154373 RepID=UPI00333421AC
MTGTRPTPSPTAATQHECPFPHDPQRWERERSHALRTGHIRDHTRTAAREPVLIHERTRWGWLAWTVPGDGSTPDTPHQIGILTPTATPLQRLALRWLTRRPARRIGLAPGIPGSLRLTAAAAALLSLAVGLLAMSEGVPAEVALPAILLGPLLADYVPDRLDARARAHVRSVEKPRACRYLQRLAVLHTCLIEAAAGSDRSELRRSAEIGQLLLWDTADLLRTSGGRADSCELIARERMMLQLAGRVAHILQGDHDHDHEHDQEHERTAWGHTDQVSTRAPGCSDLQGHG